MRSFEVVRLLLAPPEVSTYAGGYILLLGDPREHVEQCAGRTDEAKCQLLGPLITAHQFSGESEPSLAPSHGHYARHRGAQGKVRVPIIDKDPADGPIDRYVIDTKKS